MLLAAVLLGLLGVGGALAHLIVRTSILVDDTGLSVRAWPFAGLGPMVDVARPNVARLMVRLRGDPLAVELVACTHDDEELLLFSDTTRGGLVRVGWVAAHIGREWPDVRLVIRSSAGSSGSVPSR